MSFNAHVLRLIREPQEIGSAPDARLPYQVKMQYPQGIMPSPIRSFPYEILKINNLQDGIIFDIHIIKSHNLDFIFLSDEEVTQNV